MIDLLDTVALVRHFSGLGRIGRKAGGTPAVPAKAGETPAVPATARGAAWAIQVKMRKVR